MLSLVGPATRQKSGARVDISNSERANSETPPLGQFWRANQLAERRGWAPLMTTISTPFFISSKRRSPGRRFLAARTIA